MQILSLLKFSKLPLPDIEEAVQAHCTSASDSDGDAVADSIASSLKLDVEPTVSDTNIIFYVSGAIARSTIGVTKYDSCRELMLINSSEFADAPKSTLMSM